MRKATIPWPCPRRPAPACWPRTGAISAQCSVASPPIGPGADGAGFDSGLGLAFSANGGDGTLSIVKFVNGKYETVDNVPTERGARTMTVDEKAHRVYLLAAEYGPAPEAQGGQKKGRPPILPDSFHVLVVGK